MPTGRKLGRVSRLVAAILSLIWACAGVLGLVTALTHGRWVLMLPATFALWFSVLWTRVACRARLLTWKEVVTPWRTTQ
jgi:hypothetical protein